MLSIERKVFVVSRCMHGLIKEQCSICQRSVKKLHPEKVHTAIDRLSNTKTKKTVRT